MLLQPRFSVIIMLMVTGISFSGTGMAHGRRESAVNDEACSVTRKKKNEIWANFPEVKDALARFKAQMGRDFERSMAQRDIQIMVLADRVCVQFDLEPGNLGGSPVWCYAGDASVALRPRQLQLVYDGSKVE